MLLVIPSLFVFAVPAKFTAEVYVAKWNSDYVAAISGRKVVSPIIYVGNDPAGIVYDPLLNELFVTSKQWARYDICDRYKR